MIRGYHQSRQNNPQQHLSAHKKYMFICCVDPDVENIGQDMKVSFHFIQRMILQDFLSTLRELVVSLSPDLAMQDKTIRCH